jgi:hypothetical protein
MTSIDYLVGQYDSKKSLLSRYLPPIPQGIASAWLTSRIPTGSWILDPFGASPQLPVEIARQGYRVLVTANNPISRFLIEYAAKPPNQDEMRAALATLAASRKGEERLEPHIKSLYSTHCEQCSHEVIAHAFLWEKEASSPYAKIYECPYCGDSGERNTSIEDETKAERFNSSFLHRARALERVISPNDPDRSHVEEALSVYLPRAIYGIFSLINKLDTFQMESTESPTASRLRSNLEALILHACDQANTLWSHPTARERPKQLTVPPRFREINIWTALEQSVEELSSSSPPVPLTIWPELTQEEGGIVIYEGRLKELVERYSREKRSISPLQGIVASLPRQNQAFWTLSALWSGWLWGRDAVGPFKSVLKRKRYDWAWHTAALHAAMSHLSQFFIGNTPFFGLIGEVEPSFLSAVLIAANLADFNFEGLAIREDRAIAQISWNIMPRSYEEQEDSRQSESEENPQDKLESIIDLASSAAKEFLVSRAEPSSYLNLYAASISSLAKVTLLPELNQLPTETYNQLHGSIDNAYAYRRGFLRFGGSDKSLEVGQWWLQEKFENIIESPPLADRVEQLCHQYLIKNQGYTVEQIDQSICRAFTGLLTPNYELIHECLISYGEQDPDTGKWYLRPQDKIENRKEDILAIRSDLVKIGLELGFLISDSDPLQWIETDGELAYDFYITDSAMFGIFIYQNNNLPNKSLIVFPGGRSNLVNYKLRHDARLKHVIEKGWRLIKFRLIRRLSENPLLTRENLDKQLKLDPLLEEAPQLRLL